MRLTEVIKLSPTEKEGLGLPSYIDRILPVGQKLVSKGKPPVEPKVDRWIVKQEPERLVRKFSFDDPRILGLFLVEVIHYEDQVKHHAKITLLGHDVIVEVWTQGIERVTEVDIEYADIIEEIFVDVRSQFRDLF